MAINPTMIQATKENKMNTKDKLDLGHTLVSNSDTEYPLEAIIKTQFKSLLDERERLQNKKRDIDIRLKYLIASIEEMMIDFKKQIEYQND